MWFRALRDRGLLVSFLVVVGLAIGGALAYAAIPSGDGAITGCVNNRSGTVRVIDAEAGATCRSGETQVEWYSRDGVDARLATPVFAEIFADGGINSARSMGATSVDHLGTGVYRVTFERDLTACTFFVSTPYNAGDIGNASQFFQDASNSVTVTTFTLQSGSWANADKAFDIAAICK